MLLTRNLRVRFTRAQLFASLGQSLLALCHARRQVSVLVQANEECFEVLEAAMQLRSFDGTALCRCCGSRIGLRSVWLGCYSCHGSRCDGGALRGSSGAWAVQAWRAWPRRAGEHGRGRPKVKVGGLLRRRQARQWTGRANGAQHAAPVVAWRCGVRGRRQVVHGRRCQSARAAA